MSEEAEAVDWSSVEDYEKGEIVSEHKDKGACKVGPVMGGLRFYTCPPLWITQETNELLDAVFIFEDKHHMPFPGLWTEQPFWFIEAYKIYKREQSIHLKSTQTE